MAQWDLFIYLSMRVEGLSRGLVSTHVRIADIYFYFVAINFTLLTYLSMQVIIMHLKFMASVAYSEKAVVPVSVKGIIKSPLPQVTRSQLIAGASFWQNRGGWREGEEEAKRPKHFFLVEN